MSDHTPMPPAATPTPRPTQADRLLSSYTGPDEVLRDHYKPLDCRDLQEDMSLGIKVLALLQESEGDYQVHDLAGRAGYAERLEPMPVIYRKWLDRAERDLAQARAFASSGHGVDGLERFVAAVEEGRTIVGNLALADTLIPIGERLELGTRGNPDPGRYGP